MTPAHSIYTQYPFLARDISAVQQIMAQSISSGNEETRRALQRFMDAPGKMLRPLLFILAARTGHFQPDKTYTLAAAVELLHIATLIHDDIVDNSPLRRGRPTLNATEGARQAVLLGDFLFTRCFKLTADFAAPKSARHLADSVEKICRSEITEVHNKPDSQRAYLRTIYGKTAVLFMLAMEMGAAENHAAPETQSLLRRIGYALGTGFQIQDDILDYTGSPADTGKPSGNDALATLSTLPLILALKKDNPRLKKLTASPGSRRKAARIRREVLASGALEEAASTAARYFSHARTLAGRLPGSETREALVSLINSIQERKK